MNRAHSSWAVGVAGLLTATLLTLTGCEGRTEDESSPAPPPAAVHVQSGNAAIRSGSDKTKCCPKGGHTDLREAEDLLTRLQSAAEKNDPASAEHALEELQRLLAVPDTENGRPTESRHAFDDGAFAQLGRDLLSALREKRSDVRARLDELHDFVRDTLKPD